MTTCELMDAATHKGIGEAPFDRVPCFNERITFKGVRYHVAGVHWFPGDFPILALVPDPVQP